MGSSSSGTNAGMQNPPWAGGGMNGGAGMAGHTPPWVGAGRPSMQASDQNAQWFPQMLGMLAGQGGMGGALGQWAQALGLKASPQLQQAYSQMPWAKGLIGGGMLPANFTGGAHPSGNPMQQHTGGSQGLAPSDLMTAGASHAQGGRMIPPMAVLKFGQQG